MRFKNNHLTYSWVTKAGSLVLSVLLICSVLFVGDVGVLTASADSISPGSTIYLDLTDFTNWEDANANFSAWVWYKKANDTNATEKLHNFDHLEDHIYSLTLDSGGDISYVAGMTIYRTKYRQTEGSTVEPDIKQDDVWNSVVVYAANGKNCIKVTGWGENSYSWNTYTSSTAFKGGNSWNAGVGYKNESHKTGYGVGDTTIFPVSATFYDYLTDNELTNGWRSNDDNTASRIYTNRVPYTKLNEYISGMVGGPEGNWKYPLYFGNFNSHWGDFGGFPYGSLKDRNMFNKSGVQYSTSDTFLRSDSSNYTNDKFLYNFSIYANDSGPAAKKNNNNYAASVQGLVHNELVNNMLVTTDLGGGEYLVAPYFNDQTVEDGYANKISTLFPMRVNYDNEVIGKKGETVKYTTYEFDSGFTKSGVTSDNVYFTYDSNGAPQSINYGQGSRYEVIDAYQALGGNSFNHRGFFPFDNNRNTGGTSDFGYDYGFGMRLDIPFNLSEDGYITGTDEPMIFDFEGDDDVWVFVDGKLVLDLGGDHGNAHGYINFADGVATVATGTINLNSDPSYGSSEYANNTASNAQVPIEKVDGKYDVTEVHKLTLFYMERGLIESNLRMSFSISPVSNQLILEKGVNVDGVNDDLKDVVEEQIKDKENGDNFGFTFEETNSSGGSEVTSNYEYTVNGGTDTVVLGDKANLNAGDYITFKDQFGNGSTVVVVEASTDNAYKYDQGYVVTDEFLKEVSAAGDSGSATVHLQTTSDVNNAPNIFSVAFTNTVQTAENAVTIRKVLKEADGTDPSGEDKNKEFDFVVKIKLPGETSALARNFTYTTSTDAGNKKTAVNGALKIKSDEIITIPGLPVGSVVEIEETTTGYNTEVTGGTVNGLKTTVDISSSDITTDVTYTNTKVVQSATVNFKATKRIGTESEYTTPTDDQKFEFELWSCHKAGGVFYTDRLIETKKNVNGQVEFDYTREVDGSGYSYFKIVEKSMDGNLYKTDTTEYYIEIFGRLSGSQIIPTVKYYKNAPANELGGAEDVIFYNEPIPQTGSIKVVKKSSNDGATNLAGTKFAIVEAENNKPKDGATPIEKTVSLHDGEYYVLFEDLAQGEYVVYETKAPNGHELDSTYHSVTVVAGQTIDVTITNNPSTKLPQTGGMGVAVFVIVGVVLVVLAVLLLKPKKKDKTDTKSE